MKNSVFFNFLFLLLSKHKSQNILQFFYINFNCFFKCFNVFYFNNTLKKEIFSTLDNQSDFVIQKINSGKTLYTPVSWIEDFRGINGVEKVQQRVYGQYYFMPENVYFTIVGVDLFEETINKNIKDLLAQLKYFKFLEKDSMIIGNGIKKIFDKYHYFDSYDFKLLIMN
jgi:putative ABC transport system permease protein